MVLHMQSGNVARLCYSREGRSSKEVAGIVKLHYVSVNAWLTRYEQAGTDGLLAKLGRGRKPLLDKQTDAT